MITSPLIQAVLDGRIDEVRNLIKKHPEMLGIRSESGSFPYQVAVKKGLANQQTALLRSEAPGSEDFTDYSGLLIHYLGDVSYCYALANWLYDIEFVVWKLAVLNEPISDKWYDLNAMDEETKEDLRFLSQKAKGWAAWGDNDREPVFVSLEKWEKIWNERNFDRE